MIFFKDEISMKLDSIDSAAPYYSRADLHSRLPVLGWLQPLQEMRVRQKASFSAAESQGPCTHSGRWPGKRGLAGKTDSNRFLLPAL